MEKTMSNSLPSFPTCILSTTQYRLLAELEYANPVLPNILKILPDDLEVLINFEGS